MVNSHHRRRCTVRIDQHFHRHARVAFFLLALTFSVSGLAACRSTTSSTGTPVVVTTQTAIPTLTIVTPTPGAPGNAGAVATAPPATATTDQSTNGKNGSYTVQPGDTLYTIAVKFSVTVQALMQANSITDPTSLQAGQVIVIP